MCHISRKVELFKWSSMALQSKNCFSVNFSSHPIPSVYSIIFHQIHSPSRWWQFSNAFLHFVHTFPLRPFLNGKIHSRYRSKSLKLPDTKLNKSPPTTEYPAVSLLILSLCQIPFIVFTGSLSTPINTSPPFNFIAHGWSTASRLEGAIRLQNTTRFRST